MSIVVSPARPHVPFRWPPALPPCRSGDGWRRLSNHRILTRRHASHHLIRATKGAIVFWAVCVKCALPEASSTGWRDCLQRVPHGERS
eukprot:scaffold26507_cov112-Isochrysis_galbana.AAC.1